MKLQKIIDYFLVSWDRRNRAESLLCLTANLIIILGGVKSNSPLIWVPIFEITACECIRFALAGYWYFIPWGNADDIAQKHKKNPRNDRNITWPLLIAKLLLISIALFTGKTYMVIAYHVIVFLEVLEVLRVIAHTLQKITPIYLDCYRRDDKMLGPKLKFGQEISQFIRIASIISVWDITAFEMLNKTCSPILLIVIGIDTIMAYYHVRHLMKTDDESSKFSILIRTIADKIVYILGAPIAALSLCQKYDWYISLNNSTDAAGILVATSIIIIARECYYTVAVRSNGAISIDWNSFGRFFTDNVRILSIRIFILSVAYTTWKEIPISYHDTNPILYVIFISAATSIITTIIESFCIDNILGLNEKTPSLRRHGAVVPDYGKECRQYKLRISEGEDGSD